MMSAWFSDFYDLWSKRQSHDFQLARDGDEEQLRAQIAKLKAEKGNDFNIDFPETRTDNSALHNACQFGDGQMLYH